ncbi:alpha/beta hydrolase [Thalassoroseus pseudoceratinae]|uniref:alpha/beta hydrolase n=1 Tax=Thalassoroseus pseudoceratinae TaxID=2713176 RepID=UPI00141D9889|nr:alpha/beta hydrolase [Thalassoroseus pseudoceratinae]
MTASVAFRYLLLGLIATTFGGGMPTIAMAQSDAETEQVTTADGWKIPFHYYPSKQGKDAAVVLLLHGEGKNRLVWKGNGFAEALQKSGFAVIAMDYRKHGEAKASFGSSSSGSMTRRDWQAVASSGRAAGDIESVKKFIFDRHMDEKLNMSKLAIVASEEAAPVAAAWAAADWAKAPYNDAPAAIAKTRKGQDVRALILVSPAESVPGVQTQAAVRLLKDAATAFYAVAGEEMMPSIVFLYGNNSKDKSVADKLYDTVHVKPIEDRVFKSAFPTPARGSSMLKIAPIQNTIVNFLKKSVQGLDVPWQDRRSRLER